MGLEAGGGGRMKEEKIPHMCESIGHQHLRGCCPKAIQVFGQGQFGKDSVDTGKAM